MKMKLKRSIGFKMAVAMTIGLFVVISFFSHTNVRISEKRLVAMAESEASKMSNAIKSSLDSAMFSSQADEVQVIIDAVGQERMVKDIKIIDIDGQVKRAKNKAEIGIHLDQTEKSCAICHGGTSIRQGNLTVMFSSEDGSRILRNVNPIHNEQRCHGCHAPEAKMLGKLLIDFRTDDIDKMVEDNRKLLIISAVVTIFASVVLCFLLATVLAKNPLRNLLIKMKVADENAEQDLEIVGEDEIAILHETYDSLMVAIEERNRKIKRQMDELTALFNVSEILNKSDSIDDNMELILKALHIGFHVEECAILLLDSASAFTLTGCHGMDNAKTAALVGCMDKPALLEKIRQGFPFIESDSEAGLPAFLCVPLKAANAIIGVITVHSLENMEITDDELQKSFSIIATTLAPHFQIGLAQSEKQKMLVSPFNAFTSLVENEITKVREYMGSLSLTSIRITNYKDLCQTKGARQASDLVQEIAVTLSANISAVHECTRISEDTIVLILPMLDAFEAPEIVNPALVALGVEALLSVNFATYPDTGDTAIDLLHALRG